MWHQFLEMKKIVQLSFIVLFTCIRLLLNQPQTIALSCFAYRYGWCAFSDFIFIIRTYNIITLRIRCYLKNGKYEMRLLISKETKCTLKALLKFLAI